MDFNDPTSEASPEPAQPDAGDDTTGERRSTSAAVSWGLTVVLAVVLTIVLRSTLIQAYSIPSPSMVPTLMERDRVVVLLIDKDPARGDIIVFRRNDKIPKEHATDPDVLIKRVIGLPGETINAVDGKVTIDGRVLEEPYLPDGTYTTFDRPYTVGEDEYFVLGDNRGNSADSRRFDGIDRDLVVGRAVLRIWPPNRIGGL